MKSVSVWLQLWRLCAVVWRLSSGALLLVFCFPWLSLVQKRRVRQWWAAGLVRDLGVRCTLPPSQPGIAPATLIAVNHVSWLDIFVLNAYAPVAFIAKSEVRDWPLFGWLAARNETIFLQRGKQREASRLNACLAMHLQAGQQIAFFPEGTSSTGNSVLPFHPALFQGAIEAAAPVQPLAIAYVQGDATQQGGIQHCTAPAYTLEVSLFDTLRHIIACHDLRVELQQLPPLTSVGMERRDLARATHQAIADAVRSMLSPAYVAEEITSPPPGLMSPSPCR